MTFAHGGAHPFLISSSEAKFWNFRAKSLAVW